MNSNRWKKLGVTLVILLLLLQFIQPSRTSGEAYGAKDITTVLNVPDNVKQILETSCFDCHSDKTVYPWYTYVQPVGLWIQNHVVEGREELNFSEFASYKLKRQRKKMNEISEMIHDGEMPLKAYTLIHWNASLSDAQKTALIQWADAMHVQLRSGSAAPDADSTENHQEHEEGH